MAVGSPERPDGIDDSPKGILDSTLIRPIFLVAPWRARVNSPAPVKFSGRVRVPRFRVFASRVYAASPTSAPRARARAHKACVHPQIFQIGHRSSMVERSSGSHGPLQRLPQSLFTGRVYHTSFAVRVDAGSNPADDNFFFLCFLCFLSSFLSPPPKFGRCHFPCHFLRTWESNKRTSFACPSPCALCTRKRASQKY